jgi:hypothetical protein
VKVPEGSARQRQQPREVQHSSHWEEWDSKQTLHLVKGWARGGVDQPKNSELSSLAHEKHGGLGEKRGGGLSERPPILWEANKGILGEEGSQQGMERGNG